ncbi:hypothetical protein Dda_5680 [Drechslerella dactyloides]|uniref:Uncharacterized protein n=1 Tax=Drechslerella dactyloides TaxID=74499 RepID=A0AAD6NIY3_DREDA|nr:hypothetical protein Dda_5680 [Drechslerella dactyloides]
MSYKPHTRDVTAYSLRPGAVIGGVVAGLVGLAFIAGFLIYINRRIHMKRALQAKVRVHDPENTDTLSRVSTYVDEKDSDTDTIYSPTERSPVFLHQDADFSQNEKYPVEEQRGTRPPPFPVYKDIAL